MGWASRESTSIPLAWAYTARAKVGRSPNPDRNANAPSRTDSNAVGSSAAPTPAATDRK